MEETVTFGKEQTEEAPKVEEKPQEDVKEETKAEEKPEESPKEEPEEKKEEPKPEPDEFSKRFSALSRRERFLMQKEKGLNEKLKQMEEKLDRLADAAEFKKQFQDDPYGTLEKEGHSLEGYTKYVLEDGKTAVPPKELQTVQEELRQLREERNQEKQSASENKRVQIYNDEINKIGEFIEKNVEKYPILNKFADSQLIFDIRAEKFKRDSEEFDQDYAKENLMSVEEAAQLTYDYRKEELKNQNPETLRAWQKEIAQLLGEEESKPEEDVEKKALQEAEEEAQKAQKPSEAPMTNIPKRTQKLMGLKTLTNQQSTTVPARDKKKFKSEYDAIRDAAKFLQHTTD